MPNKLESLEASSDAFRAYSLNKKLIALNMHNASKATDADIALKDILRDLDYHEIVYNTDDPVKHQTIC